MFSCVGADANQAGVGAAVAAWAQRRPDGELDLPRAVVLPGECEEAIVGQRS